MTDGAPGVAAAQSLEKRVTLRAPREPAVAVGRAEALVAAQVDSPLKLDLAVLIEQAGGSFVSADVLADACGASRRDAADALDALARRGLARRRRFYNLTAEYASSPAGEARALFGPLSAKDPAELRRLRRLLLARAHLASL